MLWIFLLLFAFFAGIAQPVQSGINAQLKNYIGSPIVAAAISFVIGTIILLLISLLSGGLSSMNRNFSQVPWWLWSGGLIGAFYVTANIVLIPRLGAAQTISLILAGQMIASILIDNYGLFNVPVHSLNIPRIIGALLIVGGVAIIQKF
jgi:transporter family-2 protein